MYTQSHYQELPAPRLAPQTLITQNRRYQGTGGVSAENRGAGFRPAFMNTRTGEVYLSRFGDGRPAPIHVLDGLPANAVWRRTDSGRVAAAHGWITAGFVRAERFFTREQAATAVHEVEEIEPS